MNNFSPSTDTSVGTKRFTAQEVQLAYTLMAVEYMKTIKGLNHQLVDKAVKLKALGFTNSKEVGDAITSEEDLKVLKCYSFLQRHFPGSLILKEEDFINLNVKYGLVVGRLSAYKGSVPDVNIADSIKEKVRAAGGQTEGFLRCSLAWSNYDDLDLHVVEPNNLEIYYSNRIGRSGGKLDVDENAGYGKTRKPVPHRKNVKVAEITYSKSKGIQIRELIPSTSNSSIGIWILTSSIR